MVKEDYLLRLSMLEQESGKTEEQINLINQQISQLEALKLSLEKFETAKEKDILAPLGKGIFFKSELKEKELFVNIGAGVVVKKKPKETAEIIDRQIKEMNEIKEQLAQNIQRIAMQVQEVVEEAQKEQEKEGN